MKFTTLVFAFLLVLSLFNSGSNTTINYQEEDESKLYPCPGEPKRLCPCDTVLGYGG